MKKKPPVLSKAPKIRKKTIVINCFTGEEREVDRRKIKIIDGMEIGNTHVQLDNGVKLAVVGEGKYHTLGNPKERWQKSESFQTASMRTASCWDGPRCFPPAKRKAHIMPKRKLTNSRKRKRQESCVPQGGKLKSSDRSSPFQTRLPEKGGPLFHKS